MSASGPRTGIMNPVQIFEPGVKNLKSSIFSRKSLSSSLESSSGPEVLNLSPDVDWKEILPVLLLNCAISTCPEVTCVRNS